MRSVVARLSSGESEKSNGLLVRVRLSFTSWESNIFLFQRQSEISVWTCKIFRFYFVLFGFFFNPEATLLSNCVG